jgi:hypothetical protein
VSIDIAGFLRARLDEDEVAARAARARHPKSHGGGTLQAVTSLMASRAARALREVEADRRLLRDYLEVGEAFRVHGGEVFRAARDAYGRCVLHRASVYADHPDYRQEWKP